MTETVSRRAALVVAVAALFVTPTVAVALPDSEESETGTGDELVQQDDETVQPGEQLSGAVGVQGAEVDSAVESRAFGREVAAAQSNESKAAVVADRVERLETRLAELEAERESLLQARENGSLSEGAFNARMASLAARIDGVERQLDHGQRVAATLPAQARRNAGLNASAIDRLRSQASEMRGGEVAAAARAVGGPGAGRGMPGARGGGPPEGIPGGPGAGSGGPNEPGPPGNAGNGTATDGGPGGDRGGSGNGDGGSDDNRGNSGGDQGQ